MNITGNDNAEKFKLYTDKGVDSQLLDFGTVTVCLYQQRLAQIKRLGNENFACVLADECHILTNDAMFNPCTHQILETPVRTFRYSVRTLADLCFLEKFRTKVRRALFRRRD